ncbi:hypothetical protein Leryth_019607 [Lithospermum erythrorhizon]|nr:hypothetical protein Leryth_019607 [Lithospermum erythrorhizon]
MSSKAFFPMTVSDAASRIHLIYKVQGLEQVESFFNNISQHIKRDPVYISLLNCYANERCVEKAEDLMQKIKELGDVRNVGSPVFYKVMMNLYYRVGNYVKLDDLMNEMKEEGFNIDKSALSIRMSAYAAASDAEGVNKIVMMLESDPNLELDAITFTVAAHACLKVGLVEKSLQMIKEVERLTKSRKKKYEGYDALLHFYSKAKKKDEFLRIWDLCKQETIFNKAYISMMRGLMMFDDLESMENIFQEWESKGMPYDFRMADFLIEAFCRNGHLEKAEVLIEKGISRGGVPCATTWYYLAGGYITTNQLPRAVDALKKAISICPHDCPLSKK